MKGRFGVSMSIQKGLGQRQYKKFVDCISCGKKIKFEKQNINKTIKPKTEFQKKHHKKFIELHTRYLCLNLDGTRHYCIKQV